MYWKGAFLSSAIVLSSCLVRIALHAQFDHDQVLIFPLPTYPGAEFDLVEQSMAISCKWTFCQEWQTCLCIVQKASG